jgi:AcrR family transcriptional regulator
MGREITATRTAASARPAPHRASPFHRAIIDLCFERGFARLTISDLCRRAEATQAAFDSRYTDLEDCFFQVCRAELRRYHRHAAIARAGLREWPASLRTTVYTLHRFLNEDERLRRFAFFDALAAGDRPALLLGVEREALSDLIDEGRFEPGAPRSLTRATAESLGGGIFNQIYCASGHDGPLPPESDFVPALMYSAVLPYLGAVAAARELRLSPPPSASLTGDP